MEGFEVIKKSLEKVLNVRFKVVDMTQDESLEEEKKLFTKMINHLEKLVANEHKIFTQTGIDTSTIVAAYWTMMEEILRFAFNEEVASIIWWYVYERKNAAGDILAWEDEDGTEYLFKTPGDLYELIIYKFDL
jgi:hypothetical protein